MNVRSFQFVAECVGVWVIWREMMLLEIRVVNIACFIRRGVHFAICAEFFRDLDQ